MNRSKQITEFLKTAGWDGAEVTSLANDASFRRYDRIFLNGKYAVLMDAPPDFEDTRPFIAIANHLRAHNLNAPKILAQDIENGFLLLQDLGDDLFKVILEREPSLENKLYSTAVDQLIKLNGCLIPRSLSYGQGQHQLAHYEMDSLLSEVALFSDWYYPALTGSRLSEQKRHQYMEIWRKILTKVSLAKECLVLRDYHAENLLDLGNDKVGMLDFQDALIGHSAYDLVSLLQDARRDVSPEIEQKFISYFAQKTARDELEFREDYAILGAQRNTKIIGIFARLFLRDGKDNFLKYQPRMWGLLERCLEHPALSELKSWLLIEIPNLRNQPLQPYPLKPDHAMILAAGLGNRMRPLTDHMPKPLIKIAGKAMLSHTLDALAAAGIKNAIVNKHYLSDQIDQFINQRIDPRPKITVSDESDQLLDSGGAIKKALPLLGNEPFYVLNSDMIWTDEGALALSRLSAYWREDMDILMLVINREEALGYEGDGDFFMDEQGCLNWRQDDQIADYIYGGILIIRPECFEGADQDIFSLRDIFKKIHHKGGLFGLAHSGIWHHVGTPDAVKIADKLLKGN